MEGIERQIEMPSTKRSSQLTPVSPSVEDSLASTGDTVSTHLAEMMGDAPPCDSCGHTTVRNGSCYRCLNCGNSMGCS